jgi:hypothetical protein
VRSVARAHRIARCLCLAFLASLVAARIASAGDSPLTKLAVARFPNLTRAERALLKYAEIDNVDRGAIAICGSSPSPADPTNDPKNANGWSAERNIRAALIEWLCLNPHVNPLVYPKGIRIMGARIVGSLDLSRVQVPFAIVMNNCSIPQRMWLASTDIPYFELDGSDVGEIDAPGMNVHSDLSLSNGFHASGEVNLHGTAIGGDLLCTGGHFTPSPVDLFNPKNTERRALDVNDAHIKGMVALCCGEEAGGFRADGQVAVGGSIGSDLFLDGHFINPGKTAIAATGADITGNVLVGFGGGSFEADGLVSFVTARIGTNFVVGSGTFSGRSGDQHGLDASGISVKNAFVWHNVALLNGATLILGGASAPTLLDDEPSWPKPGNLIIDGFTYNALGPPNDARTRLRWLLLQPAYHPQPYRQLAKCLRENGDDSGAIEVLVAGDDLRYSQYGLPGKLLGGFLKTTIGYGHRPLLALLWSLGVVLVGWVAVVIGKRSSVMRPTWPENDPRTSQPDYENLQPFLYSLDVFLPFVNLHQEHYWWPNSKASGECAIFGRRLRVRGSTLRVYLWLQIIAGWLLSAIFIAGVTGLIRND